MLRSALLVALSLLSVGCAPSAGEEVSFLAPDAVPVRALAYGPGDAEAAVVLVAGREHGPASWEEVARLLAGEGWRVLAIGIRDSSDPRQTARDVEGALVHLEGRWVVLVGEGEGAAAVIWAASRRDVAGVAVLGAVAGTGIEERMRRIAEPKFLAAAVGDPEAVDLQRTLTANAPPPVEARVYPGAESGLGMAEDERVMTDILAFLHRALEVP